jgi:hypothetical protein
VTKKGGKTKTVVASSKQSSSSNVSSSTKANTDKEYQSIAPTSSPSLKKYETKIKMMRLRNQGVAILIKMMTAKGLVVRDTPNGYLAYNQKLDTFIAPFKVRNPDNKKQIDIVAGEFRYDQNAYPKVSSFFGGFNYSVVMSGLDAGTALNDDMISEALAKFYQLELEVALVKANERIFARVDKRGNRLNGQFRYRSPVKKVATPAPPSPSPSPPAAPSAQKEASSVKVKVKASSSSSSAQSSPGFSPGWFWFRGNK